MSILSENQLDWKEYENLAVQMAAEGSVLLSNQNHILPLAPNTKVSVFGRIQESYYKSGTGSGGMVNVSKVYTILEGIRETETLTLNEELVKVYEAWSLEHPLDEGAGWGNEPWSQEEMPVTEEMVSEAAKNSDVAIVVIGRTAGEDRDASNTAGSYCLSEIEADLLRKVRAGFERMIILLNVGGIIDMTVIEEVKADAVLYIWQGGMMGGLSAGKVLSGAIAPSGHLPDTIAYQIEDYPSTPYFGDPVKTTYQEDIYVGYRYFTAFAPEKVLYPFGYGLTYTDFEIKTGEFNWDGVTANLIVDVTNVGTRAGRSVVQVYAACPQGKLGKPGRVLVAYQKTSNLEPNETVSLAFQIDRECLASYDDSGVSGYRSAYVLEAGAYELLVGENSRDVCKAGAFNLDSTQVVCQLEEALAPIESFERMHAKEMEDGSLQIGFEPVATATVDMQKRCMERAPKEIAQTEDLGIKLADVMDKKATMDAFVAQMTDDDLVCIVRGEGMGSSLVTPGTASAFGGVSPHLKELGIPAVCCDDGPSGMRLDCGTKAFSLPNGTLIASTFDDALTEQLFACLGKEMTGNRVDALLGPGMNIHRHPLNGRNFEYFSEDPLLTGKMAAAQLRGLHRHGATGVIKHFAGNNQEFHRRTLQSVISERALREIYLKGFEIAVKEGGADAVMTTYGAVNGLWTAGCYDLTTTILRKEWGFTGVVMTDWWAAINEPGVAPNGTNFAAMVRAQNDMYMVCQDGAKNLHGDNTLESLEKGTLLRSQLQQCAKNICAFAIHTEAMKRLLGRPTQIEILNRPKDEEEFDMSSVEYKALGTYYEEDLSDRTWKKGMSLLMAFDVERIGVYEIAITASCELNELAQIPVSLFHTGIHLGTITFNGTQGKDVTVKRTLLAPSRFSLNRLVIGGNGLQLKKVSMTYIRDITDEDFGR